MNDTKFPKLSLKERAGKGLSFALIYYILAMIIRFAQGILLFNILIPWEMGVYIVAFSINSIVLTMSNLGLGPAIIREKGRDEEIIFSGFLSLLLFTSTGVFISCFAIEFLTGFSYNSEIIAMTQAFLIVSLLTIFGTPPSHAAQRRLMFKEIFIVLIIQDCTSLIILIYTTLILKFTLWSVFFAYLGSGITKVITSWGYIGRKIPIKLINLRFFSIKTSKSLIKAGSSILMGNLLASFSTNLVGVITGLLLDETNVGYLQAALFFVNPLISIINLFPSILFPVFSRSDKRNIPAISSGLQEYAKVCLMLLVPPLIVLFSFAPYLIDLFFSPAYAPAAGILRLLFIVPLIIAFGDVLGKSYLQAENPNSYALINFIRICFFIAAVYVLTHFLGLRGIALSILIRDLVSVLSLKIIRANTGFHITKGEIKTPLLTAVPLVFLSSIIISFFKIEFYTVLASVISMLFICLACYLYLEKKFIKYILSLMF